MSFLADCIKLAENNITKLDSSIFNIPGMSGIKNRIFLNYIASKEDTIYLEIGSWQGSTIISASYDNPGKFQCIDNFSQFGGPKNELLSNKLNYSSNCKFDIFDEDCFKIDLNKLNKGVNVYFFDGPHDKIDQKMALTYYYTILADEFIFIVDDWNDKSGNVQLGTVEGIMDCNLKIMDEYSVGKDYDSDYQHWWNGLGIFILRKRNE